MSRAKIYQTDRERKDARNKRLKDRRDNNMEYKRYICLANNHHKHIAKVFSTVTKCQCCGFERDGYFPHVHHIVHKKDGGKDELNNIVALCFACHHDLHNYGEDILKKKFNFDMQKFKESIKDLVTIPDFNKPIITLTYRGKTKTLKEWAEITGISKGTLNVRRKAGWTVERILTVDTETSGYKEWEKTL